MNKKLLAIIGLASIILMGLAPITFAQTCPPGEICNLGNQTGPSTVSGWVDVLIMVVKWLYTIVFIVAVLFILLAAFNFITSKGDATKTGTAKKQLLYAVIGIAVALLSYGVVTLVRTSLQSGLTQ